MKKTFYLLSVFTIIAVTSSCDSISPIETSKPSTIEDALTLTVIKFTNPSYKDNILATDTDNRDKQDVFYAFDYRITEISNINVYDWVAKYNMIGQSPYIELTDGYLLIDWHWVIILNLGDKYNSNYGRTILLEQKWSDLKDFSQRWSRSTPNDHESIDRLYYFKIKAIDDYRDDKSYLTTGIENHLWIRGNDSQRDSLQSVYATCLKQILNDNDYTEDDWVVSEIK